MVLSTKTFVTKKPTSNPMAPDSGGHRRRGDPRNHGHCVLYRRWAKWISGTDSSWRTFDLIEIMKAFAAMSLPADRDCSPSGHINVNGGSIAAGSNPMGVHRNPHQSPSTRVQ